MIGVISCRFFDLRICGARLCKLIDLTEVLNADLPLPGAKSPDRGVLFHALQTQYTDL